MPKEKEICYTHFMNFKTKRYLSNFIALAVILSLNAVLNYLNSFELLPWRIRTLVNCAVYDGILAYWAVSIQRRIVDRKIRHLLLNVAGFCFLWILFRTIKYDLIPKDMPDLINFFWYLYYFSQIGIAVTILKVSLYINREKEKRSVLSIRIVQTVSMILLALVLTNNYHELAFGVKENTTHAGHGPVYFVVVVWILLLTVASFVHMGLAYSGTKLSNKLVLPIGIVLVAILNLVLYFLGIKPFVRMDFTVFTIAFIVCVLESLIQINMIPSNSDFNWCLQNSSIKLQLWDRNYSERLSSPNIHTIDEEFLKRMIEQSPQMPDDNTEMFASPIRGGYAVWERDISREQELIDELTAVGGEIEAASMVLRDNIRVEGKKHELEQRNRLYDLIAAKTEYKITELQQLIRKLRVSSDEDFKELIKEINIRAVYIKRKSNMILLDQMKSYDLGKELKLCFGETFTNLRKSGIEADYLFREVPKLTIDIALILFDLLESFVENRLSVLSEITSIVTDSKDRITITLNGCLKDAIADEKVLSDSFGKWREIIDDNYGGSIFTETDNSSYSVMVVIPKGGQYL